MKYYDWDEAKNGKLKAERGISFEDVVSALDEDRLLDDLKHPNVEKYPNQRVFVIDLGAYVYLVPYVEDGVKVFLKTIIPDRKATKKYLRGGKND